MSSSLGLVWRSVSVFSIAGLTAMLGCAASSQNLPSGENTQQSTLRVWQGEEEVFGQEKGNGLVSGCDQAQYDYKIQFRLVEGPRSNYWMSQQYDWSGQGSAETHGIRNQSCHAGGSFKFGPNPTDAEWQDMLRTAFTCKTQEESNNVVFTCGAGKIDLPSPRYTSRYGPGAPSRLPALSSLRDNCSYSEASDNNSYDPNSQDQTSTHYRYSVWVSPQIDGVMKVKTDKTGADSQYWNFVPEPGKKITFLVKSNIPALFRFTLEDVSQFPGYATNAKVDDEFFHRFGLEHLASTYKNNSPDLIFDPNDFQARGSWKQSDGFLRVETTNESGAASVTVTAMDYGAYGHLRVEVKGKCGTWGPVKVEIDGKPSDNPVLTIPKDDDGNLIADKMDEPNNGITAWGYKGDPGRDDDRYPKGDGTAGDGFTAFEEYRGFMVISGFASNPDACAKDAEHVRTDPDQKDFFVYADDPELMASTQGFGESSRLQSEPKGIKLHFVCKKNMSHLTSEPFQPPSNRIVNFTLQPDGPKEFLGKTISGGAQTGIVMTAGKLEGSKVGDTRGLEDSGDHRNGLGPPLYLDGGIMIDKVKLLLSQADTGETQIQPDLPDAGARIPYDIELEHTVIHELGHAVGIDHHGDDDLDYAHVIVDGPCPPVISTPLEGLSCDDATQEKVTVVESDLTHGKHVCVFDLVARMHGLHSGNAQCPMKYEHYISHESPTHPLTYVGWIDVMCGQKKGHVYGFTGQVYPYQNNLDPPGFGHFSADAKGTGVNGLPGEQNHAGDACRASSAGQIRVKDWGSDRPAWIKCAQPDDFLK